MQAKTLTVRQQRECAVYDARSAQVLAQSSDAALRVAADCIPFPNREHVDFLSDAIGRVQPLAGKRLLECGCGPGHLSVYFAQQGASVSAVDVSAGNVALCRRRAAVNGVDIDYHATPVEALDFPDATFDVIFGNQVFHHFEREAAAANLRRMLKPGGVAVFCEPVLMVKWVRRLRYTGPVLKLLPLHRDTPDERSLTEQDLEILRRHFTVLRYAPFQVLVRAHQWLPMGDGVFRRVLRLDHALVRWLPGAARWARWAVIELR